MRILALLFLSLISHAYALDTGNGQDMNCNWNGFTIVKPIYNCLTLNITGPVDVDPSITEVIFIKVQGDAVIDDSLNLSGGADPGPGGYEGGVSGVNNGNAGAPPDFQGAAGRAGGSSLPNLLDPCSGAGGSGGRHSGAEVVLAAQDFDNGLNDCDPVVALGGSAPEQSYGNPLDFHRLIRGGSGGGAGGSADDTSNAETGASGGAGAGALKIYVGGNMLIGSNARLNLVGANGSDSSIVAGAGGGGAGGAVLISVLGDLELEPGSNINVSGGTGGTANGSGTSGTNGGRGHIRLEDRDGDIVGANLSTAPGASTGLNPDAAAAAGRELQLKSQISAGCAIREADDREDSHWILSIFLISLITLSWAKIYEATRSRMINES